MAEPLRAALIGCGRMGAFIDDEVVDHPGIVFPYCHAGGHTDCEDTVLVAAADPVAEKLQAAGERWNIPNLYADYGELIEQERPDIVSIATRPENHAEICVFAAEHGVKALYCEKPLCRSMREADAIREACEKYGVSLNLGTNRRYTNSYRLAAQLAHEGTIGELQSVVVSGASAAQWGSTHHADLMLMLAGDPEVEFVQGEVRAEANEWEGDFLPKDPGIVMGYVGFANGVRGVLITGGRLDATIHGAEGTIRMLNDAGICELWTPEGGRRGLKLRPFPEHQRSSGTLGCVQDMVRAVRGEGERWGGLRVACLGQEMILAMVESSRRGGERVLLPMENRDLTVGKW